MVGDAAVRVDLPADYRIHNTFHVSLVKPYRADGTVQPPPTVDWLNDEPYWSVERILSHRDKKEGRRTEREYLVKRTPTSLIMWLRTSTGLGLSRARNCC
jgi:hypothetical protein